MPIIKSAKKKLRKDKKRTAQNEAAEKILGDILKKAKKSPTDELIKKATSLADKAVKRHILHKNKAARIKSALNKLKLLQTKTKTNDKEESKAHKKTSTKK